MKLDYLVVFCKSRVECTDKRKPDPGAGQRCFADPLLWLLKTASQAFGSQERTRWQHACKTFRRKNKRSPGVVFHSRLADAPSEAAMSEGAPLLLLAAQVAAGKPFRDPPVDRELDSHGLTELFLCPLDGYRLRCGCRPSSHCGISREVCSSKGCDGSKNGMSL